MRCGEQSEDEDAWEVRVPKVDGSGIQLQAQNIGKGAFGKVKKVDPSGVVSVRVMPGVVWDTKEHGAKFK